MVRVQTLSAEWTFSITYFQYLADAVFAKLVTARQHNNGHLGGLTGDTPGDMIPIHYTWVELSLIHQRHVREVYFYASDFCVAEDRLLLLRHHNATSIKSITPPATDKPT
jgi:hypothetical protein